VVGILAIVRYNSNDTGEDRGEESLDRNKMWRRDRRVEGRSEEHKKAERVGLVRSWGNPPQGQKNGGELQ
jgi:hypothetical protein